MQQIKGLYITFDDNMGRGVYTALDIFPGDIIEVCPVILVPEKEVPIIHKTILHDYYFLWGMEQSAAAIALGYGSLYNHAEVSNAETTQDLERLELIIECNQKICAGEQIFIKYNEGKKGKEGIWF